MDDAEVVSVRLVRCPKCQKLLPEPSNCLIYQCGGCDAVLRAKKKAPSANGVFPGDGPKDSEKSYVKDELVGRVSDAGQPNDVFDSNTLKDDLAQKEDALRTRSTSLSQGPKENKRAESEIRSDGRSTGSWAGEETRVDSVSNYKQPLMAKTDRSESVDSNSQRDLHETPSRMNNKAEPTGLMNDAAQLDFVREWISRNYGDSVGHTGASSYACEDKESLPFSAYHRNKPFRSYESMDRSSRGSPMDADHAELLRKLEHLKMEISRIYEVPEKTGNMLFPDDREMYNSWPRPFAQLSPAEQHLYPKNHFGQFPYAAGSSTDMQDIYSHPGYSPSYPIEYRDRLNQRMRRPSHQFASNPVMESPIRRGMGFGEDLFATYARDSYPHPPTCSCLSCSQKYRPHFRSPVHQSTFGIAGTPKSPSTFGSYHWKDSLPMWPPPHGVVPVASTPVQSHHSRLPGSWTNDFHPNMDNLRSRKNSVTVHQGIKKYCHPLAGGAPFTTCPKCCELLKLPQVFKVKRLSVYNLQCGSCFNKFQVDLGNRKRDTFLSRKFPLPDETGSNEAMDEINECPERHSMANGTVCKSNVTEAYPASADNPNLKFQQEKSHHGERSENRELSTRMSQRSSSVTSVSSEDPILSNVVLRGRILQDVYKHENPTEQKELDARVDLSSKSLSASSISSHEQHMPSDSISRRIVEEESVRNGHKENKEMNSDGRRFSGHSVSSEEQKFSNELIVAGIPEEGALQINPTGKELNGGIDRNSRRLAASSVSSEKLDLTNHVIIERMLLKESQQNYLMEKQDSSEIMGQKSDRFAASFNFSEKLNASHDVIMGLDVTNAVMEPLADASSPAELGVYTVKQLPESFTNTGPSQSMTEIEIAETLTESSQKENTLNEIVVELEVDFSFGSNEYTDDRRSSDQNSQSNVGKWSESSLASFIRKSFNDFSRHHQNEDDEMTNVTVNGHPITREDLKRAEVLAGRVLPGHYWYDYFGGFWGVMGEPCLGIISPFIEEFNYPLQANCAAGNTDVFVNGRELHQIDLELLATRGLPTARNRSYKIDIRGTVYDERTGEEIKSLGLLAPSVIKAKRGFGMGVPAKYEFNVNRA
ncbi:hypothetical protein MLD38_039236 [Melastoma candidum]|uniref:Uncharacterized protein n=1 Tax=Melastoma candidum TaxID=119954 RepID=A0ACB9L3T8_9MYRT|nr:hypothetical protein MLD38_039236 [Melastoma candidum]